MKITDLKTFVVANPPPHNGGPYWVFVKLTSDSDVVGYGEAYCIPFHPSVAARMIEVTCSSLIFGNSDCPFARAEAFSPASLPTPSNITSECCPIPASNCWKGAEMTAGWFSLKPAIGS